MVVREREKNPELPSITSSGMVIIKTSNFDWPVSVQARLKLENRKVTSYEFHASVFNIGN